MPGHVGGIATSSIEINIEPPGEVMHVAFCRLFGLTAPSPATPDLRAGRACPDQYGSVVTERPFHDIVIVAGFEHRKIDNFLTVAPLLMVKPGQILAHLLAYFVITTGHEITTWCTELVG